MTSSICTACLSGDHGSHDTSNYRMGCQEPVWSGQPCDCPIPYPLPNPVNTNFPTRQPTWDDIQLLMNVIAQRDRNLEHLNRSAHEREGRLMSERNEAWAAYLTVKCELDAASAVLDTYKRDMETE